MHGSRPRRAARSTPRGRNPSGSLPALGLGRRTVGVTRQETGPVAQQGGIAPQGGGSGTLLAARDPPRPGAAAGSGRLPSGRIERLSTSTHSSAPRPEAMASRLRGSADASLAETVATGRRRRGRFDGQFAALHESDGTAVLLGLRRQQTLQLLSATPAARAYPAGRQASRCWPTRPPAAADAPSRAAPAFAECG